MFHLGIDNGLSGAITILNEDGSIMHKFIMPVIKEKGKNMYDIRKIISELNGCIEPADTRACLEKAYTRPVQGKRAAFLTGYGYGMMQAILECMGISYETVTPQTWMKEFEINSKNEKGSILFCQRKWPNERWTATERCSKAHDGLTDSACLALYCLRKNKKVIV